MEPRNGVVLCGLLCLLLATAPTWTWGQEPERVGTVIVVEGRTEVQKPGQSLWELLRFRDGIVLDDTVRTALAARTKVLLRDDVIIALAEQSELQFTHVFITRQQRRAVAGLRSGMIRVVSGRPPGSDASVEVHTANAVVSATNTVFLVRFVPPATTEVVGLLGVVTVRNLSSVVPGLITVAPNFRTQVIGERTPTPPVEVPAATRDALTRQVRVTEQLPQEMLPGAQLSEAERQVLSSVLLPEVQPGGRGETTLVPSVLAATVARQLDTVTAETAVRVPRVNVQVTFPGR